MKRKIILIGFVFILLASMAVGIFHPRPAKAATVNLSNSDIKNGSLKWLDRAHIEATFGGNKITFFDQNITDTNFDYAATDYGTCSYAHIKLSATDGPDDTKIPNLAAGSVDIDIIPKPTSVDSTPKCSNTGPNVIVLPITGSSINSPGNIFFAQTDSKTISMVDGSSEWVFSKSSLDPNEYTRDGDSFPCPNLIVVNGKTMKMYEIDSGGLNGKVDKKALHLSTDCWFGFPKGEVGSSGMLSDVSYPLGNVNDKSGVTVGNGNNGSSKQQGSDNTCESKGGALGWIMCPLILMTDKALNWVDGVINSLLTVDHNQYDNAGLKNAWGNIRNIAYIILVPIMLVMVIGTAVGYSGLDAYTVKRAMPRLLIAVIFISLSYSICKFLIDVSNAVGSGTLGLMTAPFNKPGVTVGTLSLGDLFGGSGTTVLTSIIAAPLFVVGAIVVLWLFGGTMLLFAIVAMLVLLIRQMFIVALILAAPLAILAWIFPNNDKLWKLWWGTFSKLLLMFPLIMALIAIGRIFAVVIRYGGGGSFQGAVLNPLMVLAAYMLPYALIPLTFKFAGGAFETLTGMINDRSKGIFDRQKESRARKLERASQGNIFKGAKEGGLKSRINTYGSRATHLGKAGLRPSRWGANLQSAIDAEHLEHGLEASEKLPGAKAFFASDDLMMSGLEGGGDYQKTFDYLTRSKAEGGAGWTDDQARLGAAQAIRMRRDMGAEAFDLAALAKTPGTGTAFVGDKIGEWHKMIAARTHGNKSIQASIVAAGKAGFRQAQRYEASEASFGTHMDAINDADKGKSVQSITEKVADDAYKSGGAAAVVGARNAAAAEVMVKAARRDLERAFSTGPDDKRTPEQRRKQQMRALAQVADIQDQQSGAKRAVSDVIAGGALREDGTVIPGLMDFDIGGQTALQRVNSVRDDAEFQEARRELGAESAARRANMSPAERAAAEALGHITPPGSELGGPGPTPTIQP